jgi:hypothetical protein
MSFLDIGVAAAAAAAVVIIYGSGYGIDHIR